MINVEITCIFVVLLHLWLSRNTWDFSLLSITMVDKETFRLRKYRNRFYANLATILMLRAQVLEILHLNRVTSAIVT